MNTQFMDAMGVETLTVPARSRAEEKVNKVEISLVLDISGSMREGNKMPQLKEAAGVFIDTVLRPENQDLISVNVVPYTAQVNAGAAIMDEMNITRRHDYSSCVDFADQDFDNTWINTSQAYTHMQHFDSGYSWNGSSSENAINNPGCPKRSYEEITAFSQNATALKNQINQFQPRANTSIHLGMKWGVAMLDPAFGTIVPALGVDGAFANRRKYPLNWYLNNYVNSYYHSYWKLRKYSPSQADSLLSSVCDAAKAKHIVIWSIGFEVGNHGADVMEDCASSPSHFFRVEGVEITEAFQAIARQINQLKLTL